MEEKRRESGVSDGEAEEERGYLETAMGMESERVAKLRNCASKMERQVLDRRTGKKWGTGCWFWKN